MSKKQPLVIGNWKLNPQTLKAATSLIAGIKTAVRYHRNVAVAIAPAMIHVTEVGKKIARNKIDLAAQSVSFFDGGAHTGDISATQLKDAGVKFVIIGHSEQRAANVTDADVQKKIQTVLKAGCTPVVCIGEQKRDSNGNFFSFVEKQIKSLATSLSSTQIKKIVIAYEPIWAIGTGKTATADDVREMQIFILKVLTKLYDKRTAGSVRLLYGGSVKPHNAALLHTDGGMNGFLVGGASLNAKDFGAITATVNE